MYHYSKSTGGFYHSAIHDSMPADAVEVADDEHAALMAGQAAGKKIVSGADGQPSLQDQVFSDQEIADSARAQRGALLAACDWVVLRASETGQPIPKNWGAYRQALRDLPQQKGFPRNVTWPSQPA